MPDHLHAQPGGSITSYVDNAPRGLVGTIGVTILSTSDTLVVARATTGIVELDAGIADAELVRYRWTGTAPETFGRYVIAWDDGAGNLAWDDLTVNRLGVPPITVGFANADDVAARLGRELTDDEVRQVNQAIATVLELIAEAAGTTIAALEQLDPAPATIAALCIDKAIGVVVNPRNVASESKQLGSFQHAVTYPRAADIGIFLSATEERRVRRALRGTTFAPVTLASPFSGGAIDEQPSLDLDA